MNEPASQLRIISALLIVVIALAAGLIFFIPSTQQADAILPPNENPPTPHIKVREAEISLDPSLYFTQTFGGSGNETIVETFYNDDKLYIFGNTTSKDYDFDSSGAFLAILSDNGKTLAFNSYEGDLKDVTLYNGGFLMAIDREKTPVALAVDYGGDEIKSTILPVVRAEETLDVLHVDNGYLFVTALVQNVTGFTKLKLTMLDKALEVIGSVVTDDAYSLEYIDTIDVMGEYRLVANALSSLRNMLCMGIWGKQLLQYPQAFSYKVLDFWIINGSFYYLAQTETSTVLIKEDGTIIELTGKVDSGCIMGDDKYMYISAGNTFLCVSGDKVIFSAEYGPTCFYLNSDIYSVSCLNGKLGIRSFYDGNKIIDREIAYAMTNPTILTCPSGMYVIGNTQGKFGGTDITLIKVQY